MTGRSVSIRAGGALYENIRIERTYRGNFHLYATVKGKERKFVIGKNREEYSLIRNTGISNLSEKQLAAIVKKYLSGAKTEVASEAKTHKLRP